MVEIAVIAAIGAAAIAAGLVATRRRRRVQPPADLSGFDFDAAIVAFTSTDCSTCRKVMQRVGALGVAVREVTYELESPSFEKAGVDGVPLVVVLTPRQEPSAQFGGAVSRRRLQRAVAAAGW